MLDKEQFQLHLLFRGIHEQREYICIRFKKYPNEIKISNNTFDYILSNSYNRIEYTDSKTTLFGMKIFIDNTLEDYKFDLSFTNILELNGGLI